MQNNKKEIFLVFPNVNSNVTLKVLPFGLLAVSSSLRRAGFSTVILDLNVCTEQSALERIKNESPLFVGFSVFTGPMIKDALSFSKAIRKFNKDVPLVWGGPHPTIMPDITIAHPLVTIICSGEGERSSVGLADALLKGLPLNSIPGLIFKDETGQIIKNKPMDRIEPSEADNEISLDLKSIECTPYIFKNHGKKTAIFITSRGCPYRCTFCWNLLFHNRKYTAWSSQKIFDEIKPLIEMGVEKILLFDSFLGPVSRVKAIGELLRKSGLSWAIEDGCRVDYHCTEAFFKDLAENGCSHVTFGAESGSQRVLDIISKNITIDDLINSAAMSNKYGIGARYQWMTGIPGEAKDDSLKTIDLIDTITRINPKSSHSIELYFPYPGNDLYNKVCNSGWKPPYDLDSWGDFRWEGRYPYHTEGTWYYKCIQYSGLFYHRKKLADVSTFTDNLKLVYKIMSFILLPISTLRWKLRFFYFPLEFRLAEFFRKILEKKQV
jgi:radical SAM superfamily enzyme YgiQ (UPF0313 family)